MTAHTITPFLWFDSQAEEAARHYTSVFPRSRITRIARYGEGTPPQAMLRMVKLDLTVLQQAWAGE